MLALRDIKQILSAMSGKGTHLSRRIVSQCISRVASLEEEELDSPNIISTLKLFG